MAPASYIVVWDAESDSFPSNPKCPREEVIEKWMQFTCICASCIPSDLVASGASEQEVMTSATGHTYWRDVAEKGKTPLDGLLELFDGADLIVGFNCLGFDFPLIKRFYRGVVSGRTASQRYLCHRAKAVDIMFRAKDATDRYYKLDTLLATNGLASKTSSGAKAVQMWEEGRRDELESYCAADVDLTARLALKESLVLPDGIALPNHLFGAHSGLAAQRASAALKALQHDSKNEHGFAIEEYDQQKCAD
jgi:hypothetical protein